MREDIAVVEDVLAGARTALAGDYDAYRNHVYRLIRFCTALAPAADVQTIALAAAFHALGIWAASTFDYIAPSRGLAWAYLAARGRLTEAPRIEAMIEYHHKLTPYRDDSLVEAFRQADAVDISLGHRRFGLDKAFVREVLAGYPNAGFHKALVRLFWRRLRAHPGSPAPMLRW
jgi:hypothetical protein